MPKNIVLCCDGTGNAIATDHSNVLKLYLVLLHNQSDQRTFYRPGVGSMEPPGALTPIGARLARWMGKAFGAYIENDVRDTYVFLMQTFDPGDRVFLFGFSRGAYTVRAVAALLRMYGLLHVGNEALVPYALRTMMTLTRVRNRHRHARTIASHFDLARRFKENLGRDCQPFFVGTWDTVNSIYWPTSPGGLPFMTDNSDIRVLRQAIALDERRAFFRTDLWRSSQDQHNPIDMKQVWFAGVHCDVGGGYAELDSGLSKLPLEWMLDEAETHGLLIDPSRRRETLGGVPGYAKPDPMGAIHESLKGFWHVAEYLPRRHFDFATATRAWRPNFYRRRTVPEGALVHWSVYDRGEGYLASLGLPPTAVMVPKPVALQA